MMFATFRCTWEGTLDRHIAQNLNIADALLSSDLLHAQISTDFFLATGLGLGSTAHGDEPKEGEVGRKGISCERTFPRIAAPEDLEAKVLWDITPECMPAYDSCRPQFGVLIKDK